MTLYGTKMLHYQSMRPAQPLIAINCSAIPENLLEDTEREMISRPLSKTGGNQTHAARLLRITRDTLRYKMKEYPLG